MVPEWVWIAGLAVGVTLLALWPAMRRFRRRALDGIGMSAGRQRAFHIASDACWLFVALTWTVGGAIGIATGS